MMRALSPIRRRVTILLALLIAATSLISVLQATATNAASIPRSQNIALVPDANGRVDSGGTFPTAGFPNGYAPTFSNVSPEDIRDAAVNPIGSGFDTVVLNSICDIADFLSNAQFKSPLSRSSRVGAS
jgi:putative alpha-1,2-mannosidase